MRRAVRPGVKVEMPGLIVVAVELRARACGGEHGIHPASGLVDGAGIHGVEHGAKLSGCLGEFHSFACRNGSGGGAPSPEGLCRSPL